MKDMLKRLLLCAFALAALVSASAAATQGDERAAEPESTVSAAAQATAAYTLRDWQGRIAVFARGSDAPEEITDIATDTLGYIDREKLREGIDAQSREELLRLLEDLSS